MDFSILLASIVIIICVLLHKATQKIGIPLLLAFIMLGILFGSDGILKIPFENYEFAEKTCSIALVFIMFYGGFGTSWKEAKQIAISAILLSTLGVFLTALFTASFCYFILNMNLYESLLIGAVISSTDAASVFSILRSKTLGLKHHTDSLLELESGSNDPMSYMLTILILTAMGNEIHAEYTILLFIRQFSFGIIFGILTALIAAHCSRRLQFSNDGFDMAFMIGVALLSYASASIFGGNGYLSTYLCGIILGNQKMYNKKELVSFFNGITSLMQMLIFFLLGLLATPSRIPQILPIALYVMLFLSFVARPLAVYLILKPFHSSNRQILLVSFAGLRGAASIVFAIMATVNPSVFRYDLYHITFCIVILSIAFQGTLLPYCAKWLRMSDPEIDVFKTFSDYIQELKLQLIEIKLKKHHTWIGRSLNEITLPPDMLVVMIFRGQKRFVPNKDTIFIDEDIAVLCARTYPFHKIIKLQEQYILENSKWIGENIEMYSQKKEELVIMILRDNQTIIPEGNTLIHKGDVLVLVRP